MGRAYWVPPPNPSLPHPSWLIFTHPHTQALRTPPRFALYLPPRASQPANQPASQQPSSSQVAIPQSLLPGSYRTATNVYRSQQLYRILVGPKTKKPRMYNVLAINIRSNRAVVGKHQVREQIVERIALGSCRQKRFPENVGAYRV